MYFAKSGPAVTTAPLRSPGWHNRAMPAKRSTSKSASRRGGIGSPRPYQRTAHVNEVMREVIASTLEEIGDERLEMATVTGIDVDPDFSRGVVFYSAMFTSSTAEDVQAAFDQHRARLQAAVGSQVRLKRTPLLSFRPDPAITAGQRIDDLIRNLPPVSEDQG